MSTLRQLSLQYGQQAHILHARLRVVRAEAKTAHESDPMDAYLYRRRVAMLYEMWRDTRDTATLLAHYYDRKSRMSEQEE